MELWSEFNEKPVGCKFQLPSAATVTQSWSLRGSCAKHVSKWVEDAEQFSNQRKVHATTPCENFISIQVIVCYVAFHNYLLKAVTVTHSTLFPSLGGLKYLTESVRELFSNLAVPVFPCKGPSEIHYQVDHH